MSVIVRSPCTTKYTCQSQKTFPEKANGLLSWRENITSLWCWCSETPNSVYKNPQRERGLTSLAINVRTLFAYNFGSAYSFSVGRYTGNLTTSRWFTNWQRRRMRCRTWKEWWNLWVKFHKLESIYFSHLATVLNSQIHDYKFKMEFVLLDIQHKWETHNYKITDLYIFTDNLTISTIPHSNLHQYEHPHHGLIFMSFSRGTLFHTHQRLTLKRPRGPTWVSLCTKNL